MNSKCLNWSAIKGNNISVAHFSWRGMNDDSATYWLMAWLLHQSHCGTLPHIGSCQWCRGWALSPFQAVLRSLSGWSGRHKWLGWWRDPSVRNALDSRNRGRRVVKASGVRESSSQYSSSRCTLTRSTNTMQVGFAQLWKVEIDHNIHSLNINSSCEKVCGKTGMHLWPQTSNGKTQAIIKI